MKDLDSLLVEAKAYVDKVYRPACLFDLIPSLKKTDAVRVEKSVIFEEKLPKQVKKEEAPKTESLEEEDLPSFLRRKPAPKTSKIQKEEPPLILYQADYTIEPDLLKDLEPTFSQTLFKMIKEKGITQTECYKNAGLDRKLFSKIRSDDNYKPKKATVFALIIGLKLSLEEAKKLLDVAGFSFSHSMKFDTVMEFIVKKQIFDLTTVNEILFSLDCPTLGTK